MTQSRIDQLLELLELDPHDHTLHYMIGLDLLQRGKTSEAATYLEKYLEVEEGRKGDVGACLGQLAEAYRVMGRVEEALQAYRRGIQSAIEHQHADLRNELTGAMRGLQVERG